MGRQVHRREIPIFVDHWACGMYFLEVDVRSTRALALPLRALAFPLTARQRPPVLAEALLDLVRSSPT